MGKNKGRNKEDNNFQTEKKKKDEKDETCLT